MTSRQTQRAEYRRQDGRQGGDRRRRPTNPFSLSSIFGSRRAVRRTEDRKIHFYVDRYGFGSGILFLGALLFSTLDALITLRLVAAGGSEVNPLMHFLLQFGEAPFLAVKYMITGVSLLFLLIHKEYYWFGGRLRVKYVLALVMAIYLLLFLWEVYLLAHL